MLVALLAAPATGLADEPDDRPETRRSAAGFEPPRHRSERDAVPSNQRLNGHLFPDQPPFRPLIADMKEPRLSGGLGRNWFDPGELARQNPTGNINAAYVGFGGSFDIYGWRNADCDGLQVGIFGAVFSQFDLSSEAENLINSDFQVGIPLSWRAGRWSPSNGPYRVPPTRSKHWRYDVLARTPGHGGGGDTRKSADRVPPTRSKH